MSFGASEALPWAWPLCLAIGALSGFLAGLLGIGGGLVIVPALILAARSMGIGAEDAAPVAMATSLAAVIPTSMSSARAHAARGAVHWAAFRQLTPGIAAGALAGSSLAGRMDGRWPLALFIVFAVLAARHLIRAARADAAFDAPRPLPRRAILSRNGMVIGLLSALAGVGGGLLSVPWLNRFIPLRAAIGTAAALGLPLASAGLLGYALAGDAPQCGADCIGHVFVPGALAISLAAVVSAPLGARAAHRMPVRALQRVFAVLMLAVAVRLTAELVRWT